MKLTPVRIEAHAFRCPVERPVVTSFGVMTHRPALLVRAVDQDGAEGWGEIFCNWPARGFANRAMLVRDCAEPVLAGHAFDTPGEAWRHLTGALHVLAVQTGEPGPLAGVAAGIDIALWDLWARRRGEPLYRALGGQDPAPLPVYASGINRDGAVETVAACRNAGHKAFKIKIGFDAEEDRAVASAVTRSLGAGETWMIDVNQGWDVETACREAPRYGELGAAWIEEPIAADQPPEAWKKVAAAAGTHLAGGENLAGNDFDEAIAGGWLGVLQPDVCKWGGLTGCLEVARAALAAGRRYSPHYLGGGIGLLASAHLLAAVGGDGLLELDVNPNPFREKLAQPFPDVSDGHLALSDAPGLGVSPNLDAVEKWRVTSLDLG
jgi:D-galactarolactone cycloisomerase